LNNLPEAVANVVKNTDHVKRKNKGGNFFSDLRVFYEDSLMKV
jgi:hypothetical protein